VKQNKYLTILESRFQKHHFESYVPKSKKFKKKQPLRNVIFEIVFLNGILVFLDSAIQVIESILKFLEDLIATQGPKEQLSQTNNK
jgi:hypothetical protein